jgi:glycogenin glucosyltransferase
MYNTVCKHKSNARWPEMRRQARMLHYTSETKPWTFFSGSHKFWRQNFDAASFYLWARQFRQVLQDLELDGHDPMHPWHNANRVQALCDAAYNQLEENNNAKRRSPAPERPLISVVIHGWKSLESLEDTIYFYRRLLGPRSVRQVLVYWGPRRGLVPPVLGKYKYARQPPVIVVRHRYESANNLWNPLPVHQVNQPVLFVDDHNFLDADRLDLALDIWTHSPLQLVGFFPRYHHRQVLNATLDPSMSSDTASLSESPKPTAPVAEFNATSQTLHHRLTYNLTSAKRPHPYSLVSPSLLLVSSDHLFTYTCLLPERIHRHVDDHGESIRWGGADLALNLLTQGMANVKPIVLKNAFHDVEKEQFAVVDGYAAAKGHLLMDLLRLFAPTNQLTKDRDFLQLNPAIVGPYHKVPFRKRSIKRWNN